MSLRRRRRITSAAAAVVLCGVGLAGCGSHSAPVAAGGPAATPSASPASQRTTCPLTGEPATQAEHPTGDALAVKVDNISEALPQAGINDADVVVEELVEGGLTRLVAIFQCAGASSVGPIRSARITDADLLALLHGSVFAFSGANPADLPPIEAHGDAVMLTQDSDPQYFHDDPSRPAPHDVFASTSSLLAAGRSQRHSLQAPPPLFSYGALPHSARPASAVSLAWPAASARWTWSDGQWLRTQDGSADDVVGGAQVHASDVVVLSVHIASTGLHDVIGTPVPLDVTTGQGKVWVLRDGHVVTGTWSRSGPTAPLHLATHTGATLDLAPGHTWVELLPSGSSPTVSR